MFVSEEIVNKIIELAGVKLSESEISETDIKKALIEIERKLNFFSTTNIMHEQDKFNILIVDDLELTVFQLSQLLKKMGTTLNVARNKEEALAEIRKKNFDYIVTDLYLPDLADGLSLIDELNKYKSEHKQNYKIIAISSTDDEKIIQQVYSSGVDEFVAKSPEWHNEIVKYIASSNVTSDANFSMFVCEDNICVYSIRQLHTEQQKNDLQQSISASIYSGKPNVILNVERLRTFSEEFTPMFSEIYKMCRNANGEFIILSPSKEIETELRNAFLYGLIKTANSINDAVFLIKNAK